MCLYYVLILKNKIVHFKYIKYNTHIILLHNILSIGFMSFFLIKTNFNTVYVFFFQNHAFLEFYCTRGKSFYYVDTYK